MTALAFDSTYLSTMNDAATETAWIETQLRAGRTVTHPSGVTVKAAGRFGGFVVENRGVTTFARDAGTAARLAAEVSR